MGRRGLRNLRKSSRESSEPRYFEDYDRNDDDVLNVIDAQLWAQAGRNDVAQRLARMIGSGNMPKKRADLTKPQRQRRNKMYGIPRKMWMKMNPRERRAQYQIFKRSRQAQVQGRRRTRRMFRGSSSLSGRFPGAAKRGRLQRTSQRMHRMLERRRKRFRIRRLGLGRK